MDHDGECKQQMMDYLKCMKFTENLNAPNCRILAKNYLKCRMDNQLMDQSEWDSLGLVNLPNDTTEVKKSESSDGSQTTKEIRPVGSSPDRTESKKSKD